MLFDKAYPLLFFILISKEFYANPVKTKEKGYRRIDRIRLLSGDLRDADTFTALLSMLINIMWYSYEYDGWLDYEDDNNIGASGGGVWVRMAAVQRRLGGHGEGGVCLIVRACETTCAGWFEDTEP